MVSEERRRSDPASPQAATPRGGVRGAARAARTRVGGLAERPRAWVASGDEASTRSLAVSWWRLYRGIDGPLQSLLLTVYVFLAILPAILVLAEYLQRNPAALANHLVSRYHITGSAAGTLRDVLVGDRTHELGSALFAIATVLIFGLGFGRVLELVYARAWGLELRERLGAQVPHIRPARRTRPRCERRAHGAWDRHPHVRLERRDGTLDRPLRDGLPRPRCLHGPLLLARAELDRDRRLCEPLTRARRQAALDRRERRRRHEVILPAYGCRCVWEDGPSCG